MRRKKYSKFVMENTSWLQRLLWICAGVNIEALAKSPEDWRKQSVIGTMVIVTAAMAFISSALYLNSLEIAGHWVAFGSSFWATVIFIIDRAMLVFWQKGQAEWKRLVPRLVLSTLIWITVGKAMFAFAMSGEINREIAKDTKAAVEKIQTGSIYEEEKKRLKEQLTGKETSLKQLKDDVLNAERELDQEMGGVRVEERTTGIVGKGPKYQIKAEVVGKAKERLDAQEPVLSTEIEQLSNRLATLQSNIDAEANEQSRVEKAAAGPERRLRIMLSLMLTNPLTALIWFMLALVLLIIETAPVLLKFFAEEGDYDRTLLTIVETNKARHVRHMAIISAVSTGNNEGLIEQEVDLAGAFRNAMLEDIRHRIFSTNGFGEERDDRVKVSFVAPGYSADTYDIYLVADEANVVTLAHLKRESDSFIHEIAGQRNLSLDLQEARNSNGDLIEPNFVPLVRQLTSDLRVLLRLSEICEANSAS